MRLGPIKLNLTNSLDIISDLCFLDCTFQHGADVSAGGIFGGFPGGVVPGITKQECLQYCVEKRLIEAGINGAIMEDTYGCGCIIDMAFRPVHPVIINYRVQELYCRFDGGSKYINS